MISFRNISKFYINKNLKYRALYNVSFDINFGDYVLISGEVGCGKTTLLNVLGCIDKYDEGEYIFGSKNISSMNDFELSKLRNENFGFVFEYTKLIPELNLFENVELPLLYSRDFKKDRKKRVLECLDMIGLEKYKYSYVNEVSKEFRQKICIARALVGGAKIILADEPTKFLDEGSSQEILNIFYDLNRSGFTVIVSGNKVSDFIKVNKIINLNDGILV